MREPDRGEFEAFARRVSPRLLRSAYLLTGDLHLAQDVVQEALQKVAARWRTLDASPEAYARRIVATTTAVKSAGSRGLARLRELLGDDARLTASTTAIHPSERPSR
jgi:hypothetical protein